MDNNICQTCLSKDRRLLPQRILSNMFQEINIWELKETTGGICWECHHMLVKFTKFKAQVRHAQESIIYMVQDTKPLSHLSTSKKTHYDYQFFHNPDPLTNNKCITEINIVKDEFCTNNYVDVINRNNINEENCDEKPELTELSIDFDLYKANDKDDTNADDYVEHANLFDEEKPITTIGNKLINISNESIYTETITSKVRQKRKGVKNKVGKKLNRESQASDTEEVKEKFSTIIFTEKEMLKNREEKRSHPNFKKIPFKCDSCVLGFTRKETYDAHMEKKHHEKIGQYICDVCLIRFPNKKSIERHCRKHFVCYRCRLCKYETVELWSALNHCRAKHSADKRDRIHCGQCQAVAKTPEDLAEHIRSQHSLYCNECGEKFKGKHTLRKHLARIHSVKGEFICDICSRQFVSKSRLESHMVAHNPGLARRLAYCDACRVQYKNIYVYRSHVRNSPNHAARAYPCPECNKKFVSKIYWTKHYNFYHLQKSQFSCEICNKLFISGWRLKNHKQKHHGLSRPRDHPCNICGKKFYTQATLRGHQLTHSAQRSYMCEDCGDTFKQRPALYNHTRLVHQGYKRPKP